MIGITEILKMYIEKENKSYDYNRYKLRLEEKQKEREILEKRRILKLKQREEQLKKDEAAK